MGKFHFIQLFYGKTMNAFKESELCIKNVFFWDTFCSSSSKNERRGGDQFLQFLLNRLPHHSFIFCATLTLCISKEHIFHTLFKLYKSIHSFAITALAIGIASSFGARLDTAIVSRQLQTNKQIPAYSRLLNRVFNTRKILN